MKKSIIAKPITLLSIGIIISAGIVLIEKIQSFVSQGLQSGKNIRVSETNNCETGQKNKPQFSGCNSVL